MWPGTSFGFKLAAEKISRAIISHMIGDESACRAWLEKPPLVSEANTVSERGLKQYRTNCALVEIPAASISSKYLPPVQFKTDDLR